jgi:hypothetical protein
MQARQKALPSSPTSAWAMRDTIVSDIERQE